jgi:hypothetical protein
MSHYGIRSAATSRLWASSGATKWTSNDREALRVDSMQEALLYAYEFLNLDLLTFTIEALPVSVIQPLWRTRQ